MEATAQNQEEDRPCAHLCLRDNVRIILNTHSAQSMSLLLRYYILTPLSACIAAGFLLSASIQFLYSKDATYAPSAKIVWACAEITCGAFIFSMLSVPKAFRDSAQAFKTIAKTLSRFHFSINRGNYGISIVERGTSRNRPVSELEYQLINENSGSAREFYSTKAIAASRQMRETWKICSVLKPQPYVLPMIIIAGDLGSARSV
ncbi:hypothetical protein F5Y06DRAFT_304604 [Hypoxylon sp. FL0890]|nr:hypothetical protein F5Y06DRAFT_304604 [Hypoxylon sp. FL0890]